MSPARQKAVDLAFAKLDINKSGTIDMSDVR